MHHMQAVDRLDTAEARTTSLEGAAKQLSEVQELLRKRQENDLLPKIGSMQSQLTSIESAASQADQDVRALEGDLVGFKDSMQQNCKELAAQVQANKDHVEFLLQETDMIKRRSREMTKKQTTCFKEVSEEQERVAKQLQDMDSSVKKQARDVRAIENRANRGVAEPTAADLTALAGLRALPLALEQGPPADTNTRLTSMMDQLEKLANGGPPAPYNPERPPLPVAYGVAPRAGTGIASDTGLPRFAGALADHQAPIDSARGGGPATSASVRGMYGLSPRVQTGSMKKKNRS